MIFVRTALVVSAFLASSISASAACSASVVMNTDKVGRDLWVVQYEGDYPTVPRFAADHRGFTVYPQKQTGPERWQTDTSAEPIMVGTKGTVLSVASVIHDNPSDFNVRLEDGREVVLDSLQFTVYDFYECDPAILLENRSDSLQYERQHVYYLPLKLVPGARPLDSMGDWIDEEYLEKLALLDCTVYNQHPTLKTLDPDLFRCVPVWKDGSGIDINGYDTPRHFEPRRGMVEHATIEDLSR